MDKERFVAAVRNSAGKEKEQKRNETSHQSSDRLFIRAWEHGPSELGQVASGSATQSLWMGNRKVGSQVVVVDQCQLLGRGTDEKIGRGGR